LRRKEMEALKRLARSGKKYVSQAELEREAYRRQDRLIKEYAISTPTYEIFEAGRHRLICGDSTDLMFISSLIEEMDVNVVIYDPPYHIDGAYDHIPMMQDGLVQLILFWDCKRAADAHISAHNKGWPFFSEVIWDNCQVDFRKDNEIDWAHKTCGIFGNVNWSSACATQFMPLKDQRGLFTQHKKFSSIYKEKKTNKLVSRHQHSKPDHWIQSIISGAGGFANRRVALDMFGGGGSTLIAMEKVGGRAVIVEKDNSTFERLKSFFINLSLDEMKNAVA